MITDELDLTVKAGNGGRGIVSFGKMRKSGPDGGNGGKGADVYVVGKDDLSLLNNYTAEPLIEAEDGGKGGKDKRTGRNGTDLYLSMPVGTLLHDTNTGEEFELLEKEQTILIAVGGTGGIGNFELRSSTNITPLNTIPPKKGQRRELHVTLRFLADYGLIGLPSAGKSSLLNALTNTDVKTAEYHFTTLSPNLGVLPGRTEQKIIADIPGLIEGASQGRGLGIKFLKHIEKVDTLLHCISIQSEDPLGDYKTIWHELDEFSPDFRNKKEIILVTKTDLAEKAQIKKFVSKVTKLAKTVIPVSIIDDESLQSLFKILD